MQVKTDQTAAFEEMFGKIKAGLDKSSVPELKAMANVWKIYKTAEGMQGNALYVVVVDPAVLAMRDFERIGRDEGDLMVGQIDNLVGIAERDAQLPEKLRGAGSSARAAVAALTRWTIAENATTRPSSAIISP